MFLENFFNLLSFLNSDIIWWVYLKSTVFLWLWVVINCKVLGVFQVFFFYILISCILLFPFLSCCLVLLLGISFPVIFALIPGVFYWVVYAFTISTLVEVCLARLNSMLLFARLAYQEVNTRYWLEYVSLYSKWFFQCMCLTWGLGCLDMIVEIYCNP